MIIIFWDEVSGEVTDSRTNSCDITLPDEELIAAIQEIAYEDPHEPTWNPVKIMRGERTATIEWRSQRGHLSVTTLIWE